MHPWLAVVAIRIMAIKKRTTNARWARSLGKRILNIYSGAVLCEGAIRSSPKRFGSISQLARGSTVPNPAGKIELS